MNILRFRYLPGFLPMSFALGLFFLYGSYLVAVDPDLFSPKGLFILGLVIFGDFGLWWIILKLWQTDWSFTLTPTHFIAERWLPRKRIEISWEAIIRVRKLPHAWWSRGAEAGFSQIETTQGHQILVGPHMLHYGKFLQELKARAVNCREFDPYYLDW